MTESDLALMAGLGIKPPLLSQQESLLIVPHESAINVRLCTVCVWQCVFFFVYTCSILH